MKNLIRSAVLSCLVIAASLGYGGVPAMNVTVSDAGGKAAYKGMTNASGTFATAKLTPGNYVVQFTSKSAPKGGKYAMVVSAGTKKVTATAVAAEKLAAGGVAMKIDVGAGLNITGQVAANDKNVPLGKDGVPMVWIPGQLGSNKPAHWAEADSAEAKQAQTAGSLSNKNLQDRMNSGASLLK